MLSSYVGQSGVWTFESEADAERFAEYAGNESAPALSEEALTAAGVPTPVHTDVGWTGR